MVENQPALEVRNISKLFAGQVALDDVNLTLLPGKVHALVGQNGSGKSTLIKVLAGYHQPESGMFGEINGAPYPFGSGSDIYRQGVRFVHQQLDLVDDLSIIDNLALTRGFSRRWWVSLRHESKVARAVLNSVGLDVDPRTLVRELSPVERTLTAIARALDDSYSPSRVVVLDEPTAALPKPQIGRLFEAIKSAAQRGVAVLYVSHNIDEIIDIADEVTVLRDGCVVAHEESVRDARHLMRLILGTELDELNLKSVNPDASADGDDTPVLRAVSISGYIVENASFEVRSGEVLGFAGLLGSGREEIPYLCAGAFPLTEGWIEIAGVRAAKMNPRRALAKGIAFVASDRNGESAIPSMLARENITLPLIRSSSFLRWLSHRKEKSDSNHWMTATNVQPANSERVLSAFSGGNQQKIVLSRALRTKPKLLIIDQPVQGVDVGNKARIFRLVNEQVEQGLAVIVCSSDPEDLVTLCHRVIVIRDGRLSQELKGSEISVSNIGAHTMSVAVSVSDSSVVR
jgi:ribose transport system ATP-binding protein